MSNPEAASEASAVSHGRQRPPDPIKVTIVGAGMAGLTAALRLAERGCEVTVYEQKPYPGGQFGAHTHDNGNAPQFPPPPDAKWRYHEHCYHMLLNWYCNFWKLADDIGLDREEDFEPRAAVRHLSIGDSRMPALVNPGSANYVWDNLLSGLASPPDMFLYAYSLIDLLAQPIRSDGLLGKYTVNGFLQTRPYASERSAELHERTMAKAFGAPSYLTSASSYKNLIKYGLRQPEPMMWLLKGNTATNFHVPFYAALKDPGPNGRPCLPTPSAHVMSIGFRQVGPRKRKPSSYRATVLEYQKMPEEMNFPNCTLKLPDCSKDLRDPLPTHYPPLKPIPGAAFDYLILAVPPHGLANITIKNADKDLRLLADLPPIPRIKLGLPPIPKLKVQPMASLDLYFKRQLPGLAREHVVLVGSAYGLTYLDNSQVGSGAVHTILNVVASDFDALSNLTPDEAICAILFELAKYIPFDASRDLDAIHFQTNIGDELFVNEVGSEQWRPRAQTQVPNMFLAGDYCRTFVDIVSVEAAVVSGLEAARAVQAQVMSDYDVPEHHPLRIPIDVLEPESFDEVEILGLKMALAPYAYAAKCLSSLQEAAAPSPDGACMPPTFPLSPGPFTVSSDLLTTSMKLMVAPWVMAAECLTASCSEWGALLRQFGGRR